MRPSTCSHSDKPSQHIPTFRGCGQAVPVTKIAWLLTYSIICVRQISLKKIIFDKHDSFINYEKRIHFIVCCIRVVFSRRWMARWKHCGRRLFRTCIISWFIKWTAHQKEWNEIEWIEKWFLLINTHTKRHPQNVLHRRNIKCALHIHNPKNRERPQSQQSAVKWTTRIRPTPALHLYYSDRVFCVSSSSVEVCIGQRVDLLGLYCSA